MKRDSNNSRNIQGKSEGFLPENKLVTTTHSTASDCNKWITKSHNLSAIASTFTHATQITIFVHLVQHPACKTADLFDTYTPHHTMIDTREIENNSQQTTRGTTYMFPICIVGVCFSSISTIHTAKATTTSKHEHTVQSQTLNNKQKQTARQKIIQHTVLIQDSVCNDNTRCFQMKIQHGC